MREKLKENGIKNYTRLLMDIICIYILGIMKANGKLSKQLKEYNTENKEEEIEPISN